MQFMKRLRQIPPAILGNAVLFQGLWLAAVLGASLGRQWPALVMLLALVALAVGSGASWRAAGRMALAGLLAGMLAERVWLSLGLIEYRLAWSPVWPPVWIMVLWVAFAMSLNHSLAWLQGRVWLAAVFGAIGSVGSVLAGVRWGAASAPAGWLPLAVWYGLVWALLVPALAWWAARGAGPGGQAMWPREGRT